MNELNRRIRILAVELEDKVRCERAMKSLYNIATSNPSANTNKERVAHINRIHKARSIVWQKQFVKIGCYIFDRLIHEVDKSYKRKYEFRELNSKGCGILTYCRHPDNDERKDGRCYAPNCSCPGHFALNAPRLFYEFLRTKRTLSLKKQKPDDFTTLVLGFETQTEYKVYMMTKCHAAFGEVPYDDMSIDEIKPCSAFDIFDEVQALQCFNYKNNQLLFRNYSQACQYGYAERQFVNSAKRNDPCSTEHEELLSKIVFSEKQKSYMRGLVSEFLEKRLR